VLLWQTEQSCVVLIWFVPIETGVTFWNAAPLWQVAQPEVMPVWLIVPVANPPGVAVLLWQTEQSCVVLMWFEPTATGVVLKYAVPLWQVAQPEVMPVWLIFVSVVLYPLA
jgi:hypothetical protein